MPLLHERAQLVAGDVQAVEVGVAVVALHLFALDAHLSVGLLVSVLVQITQRDLENATTQRVGGNFYSTQSVSQSRTSKRANFAGLARSQKSRAPAPVLTLSGRFIARGQGRGRVVEVGRHAHVVPLLLDERMGATQKRLVRYAAIAKGTEQKPHQPASVWPESPSQSPIEFMRAAAAPSSALTPSSYCPSS